MALPGKDASASLAKPLPPPLPAKAGQDAALSLGAVEAHWRAPLTGKLVQQDKDAKTRGAAKPLPKVVNPGSSGTAAALPLGNGEILKAAPVSSFGFLPATRGPAPASKGDPGVHACLDGTGAHEQGRCGADDLPEAGYRVTDRDQTERA
ncbi:MAG: hypothetical protein WDN28_08845 [Chthoniobacter sp.]